MRSSTSVRSSRFRDAVSAVVEPLETRRLLSTINWVNKGTGAGAGDTDSFNARFGANATLARNIVQRAIDDWEKVIVNFNGAGGRNSYDLTVNAVASLGAGTFASTAPPAVDALNKPSSTTISIDDDSAGQGWYFDPVIGTSDVPDDSEFTSFVTPYVADLPTQTGRDLYRSTLHEIGHAMGLGSSEPIISPLLVDAGDDPVDPGTARLNTIDFNGDGTPDYTFTTIGGGHLFEGGGGFTGPVFPNELLNAGRTVSPTQVRRGLISDTLAQFYVDLFGYTVKMPSTINTFYANLNTTTNTVTINGDLNAADISDNIDLEVTNSLTDMSFEANGTDEVIPGGEFTSIIVNAGDGGDDIDVDELLAGKFVTVNGDGGNDRIQIAPEFGDVGNDLLSDVITNGGTGTDTLTFNDTSDPPGNDDYTFFSPSVACGSRAIIHSNMEHLELTSSREASIFNINATASTYSLDIIASGASDTFNVGDGDYDSNIQGDISIDGQNGGDTLNIDDDNDTGNGSYTLTPFSFNKTSGGTLDLDSIEKAVLNASGQGSLINVDLFNSTMAVTVNAGAGNDTLDVDGSTNDIDNGMLADISFFGQGGTDRIELDDSGDSADPESYDLTGSTFTKSSASGELDYDGTEQVHLVGNDAANTITVELGTIQSPLDVTVGGGGGDDQITSLVSGTFSLLAGNVTLQGGPGTDTITLDDSTGSISNNYTLTSNTIQATEPVPSGLITYTAEVLDVTTSAFDSTIHVDSTNANTDYSIHADDGDDTIIFGGSARNVGEIQGDVTVFGGTGADRLEYNDDNNTVGSNYIVSTNNILRTGSANVDPSGIEQIVVNAGDGSDTVTASDTFAAATTTVNGHGGNDTIDLATGLWSAGIQGPITVNGGGGSDSLFINDSSDIGLDNYTVTQTQTTKTGGGGSIDYGTIETYTLDANTDANTITVNSTFDGDVRVDGNGGADTIDVVGNFFNRFVRVDGGAGLDNVLVNSDAVGVAAVEFDVTQDLQSLHVYDGGTARMNAGGNKVLSTRAIEILGSGMLDMTDEDMIVDYTGATPIATVRGYIATGYAAGAWNGIGINSSTAAANASGTTALGYGESVNVVGPGGGVFSNISVDNTAVLVKYTYRGDADLDGDADGVDIGTWASNFTGELGGTGNKRWGQGDWDYDGDVDGVDSGLWRKPSPASWAAADWAQ